MHYYVYVSDSKVDMLFSQIPRGRRKQLVTELKVDVKVVSVSIKDSPTEDTRYSKLEVVHKFLEGQGLVGSVDNPAEYFAGALEMKWGPYGGIYGEEREMVYFGARTEQTVLGMGGSMKHVIGAGSDSGGTHAHSATPALYAALSRHVAFSQGLLSNFFKHRDDVDSSMTSAESGWDHAVWLSTTQQRGGSERLDFLARKVNYVSQSPQHGSAILLGSPIYVRYVSPQAVREGNNIGTRGRQTDE